MQVTQNSILDHTGSIDEQKSMKDILNREITMFDKLDGRGRLEIFIADGRANVCHDGNRKPNFSFHFMTKPQNSTRMRYLP